MMTETMATRMMGEVSFLLLLLTFVLHTATAIGSQSSSLAVL
jgi:hypothetical protein